MATALCRAFDKAFICYLGIKDTRIFSDKEIFEEKPEDAADATANLIAAVSAPVPAEVNDVKQAPVQQETEKDRLNRVYLVIKGDMDALLHLSETPEEVAVKRQVSVDDIKKVLMQIQAKEIKKQGEKKRPATDLDNCICSCGNSKGKTFAQTNEQDLKWLAAKVNNENGRAAAEYLKKISA
jgi:hypothetical protein